MLATCTTLRLAAPRSAARFHACSFVQAKETVESLTSRVDLRGKRVLVRADLNVPLAKDGSLTITDDTRIRGCLPTVQHLQNAGAKVVLCSHFGKPKGEVDPALSLAPVSARLSELLGQEVPLAADCVGADADAAVAALQDGQVVLLENTRFHKGETKNEPGFVAELAKHGDVFVNDAFGAVHRAHASTAGVAAHMEHSVAGFLVEKELKFLSGAVDEPARPMAAVIGGAKVSTKLPVVESLMAKCDKLVIGGGMIFTFYLALGHSVGDSLVELEQVEIARRVIDMAAETGTELLLPTDVVVADAFAADAASKVVGIDAIPDGMIGLDIGPDSIAAIEAMLQDCQTVVWNGPMGVFEFEQFAKGTMAVAECMGALTPKGVTTIVGGGDSVAAVQKAGLGSQMSHISTGGGASLELLEGKVLPGIDCLDEQ